VDTNTLVSDLINDGRKIAEQLPKDGFEVTAAFWLKKSEDDLWYYYIASPAAESASANGGYGRLFTLIRQMPEPHWIDPLEVRLIGPNHPITKDVLAIHNLATSPKTSPIQWSGRVLGKLYIDGAYLYPLYAMAPSS
jgi:hypothetical protein